MSQEYAMNPQTEFIDPQPYGNTAHPPAKTGLTKRGKAAIAIGVTVLATGGLIFWQHNSASEAASQAQQQEYALENKKLDLQMLQAMNQANAANQKQQNTADQQREKQVSACVNTNKSLVGKEMGVNYQSVLKDCQDQFPATTDSSDMQNTASSSSSSGSGVNGGLLIGGGVLVCGVLLVARKRPTVSNSQ
jgi:hypothetical protein